jgi:hypothetical protein
MINLFDDKEAVIAKVLRHESSAREGDGRIWVYRNDLGEELLSNSKYDCTRAARQDLRLCRVDVLIDYTAEGKVKGFEYSDTYSNRNIDHVSKRLEASRREVHKLEKWIDELCRERDDLRKRLRNIERYAADK